jgi:hypothetical protein
MFLRLGGEALFCGSAGRVLGMRTDDDDGAAIAAWDAYSSVHKGFVEAHGGAFEHEPQAPSVTIDRTVETIEADQATGQTVRSLDGLSFGGGNA